MHLRTSIAVALLVVSSGAMSQPSGTAVSGALDPDGTMYGLRFGATETQVTKALGEPAGRIKLSESRTAFVFGPTAALILRRGKLNEVILTSFSLSYQLLTGMEEHPAVNAQRAVLNPGIKMEMSFQEVAKLLNRPNAAPQWRLQYETQGAEVELTFSKNSSIQDPNLAYSVAGIRIKSLTVQ